MAISNGIGTVKSLQIALSNAAKLLHKIEERSQTIESYKSIRAVISGVEYKVD